MTHGRRARASWAARHGVTTSSPPPVGLVTHISSHVGGATICRVALRRPRIPPDRVIQGLGAPSPHAEPTVDAVTVAVSAGCRVPEQELEAILGTLPGRGLRLPTPWLSSPEVAARLAPLVVVVFAWRSVACIAVLFGEPPTSSLEPLSRIFLAANVAIGAAGVTYVKLKGIRGLLKWPLMAADLTLAASINVWAAYMVPRANLFGYGEDVYGIVWGVAVTTWAGVAPSAALGYVLAALTIALRVAMAGVAANGAISDWMMTLISPAHARIASWSLLAIAIPAMVGSLIIRNAEALADMRTHLAVQEMRSQSERALEDENNLWRRRIHDTLLNELKEASYHLRHAEQPGAIAAAHNAIQIAEVQLRKLHNSPSPHFNALWDGLWDLIVSVRRRPNARVTIADIPRLTTRLPDLPSEVIDALLGATGEAVRNAARHAAPCNITIQLGARDNGVEIRISDTGSGKVPDPLPMGGGIRQSILEPVERVGGVAELRRHSRGHTWVLRWPNEGGFPP
jgi:anti-sigma regulatory factor (Ser/Thr protein kinase)